MNYLFLITLAFVGGIFLAMQGAFNAHLGVLLKNPLLASVVAFFFSTLFAIVVAAVSVEQLPSWKGLSHIPWYKWFAGGLFSVLGISLYYYTIPKLGISTMISLGLCGQLIFSVIAGHFGWLNLPTEPITLRRVIGVISMIIGIVLIQLK